MKKIAILLLALITLATSIAYARPNIIKDEAHLTAAQEKLVHEIAMKTTMSEKEIAKYLKQGLNKYDIFNCYTIWSLADKDMDDIVKTYREENDLSLTLKDYDISESAFLELYEILFPEEEQSPIRRNNVPWLQSPQK